MSLLKTIFSTVKRYALASIGLGILVGVFSFRSSQQKILVFSRPGNSETTRLAHLEMFQKLGNELKIALDTTGSTTYFTEDSLSHYYTVVFLDVPLEVLDYRQQADFERYLQA